MTTCLRKIAFISKYIRILQIRYGARARSHDPWFNWCLSDCLTVALTVSGNSHPVFRLHPNRFFQPPTRQLRQFGPRAPAAGELSPLLETTQPLPGQRLPERRAMPAAARFALPLQVWLQAGLHGPPVRKRWASSRHEAAPGLPSSKWFPPAPWNPTGEHAHKDR